MEKQTNKILAIPIIAFILSIGLIAGCSNSKKSNTSGEMESDTTSMSGQAMQSMQTTYTGSLKGESETPAVTTEASGSVTVTLNGDELHIQGRFSGLSSEYTASHIHKAAVGEAGGVVQPLDPTLGDDNMSGTFDNTYTVSDSVAQALKNGMLYVNVHSQQHKDGEIRGQLTASEGDTNSNSME